MYGKSYDGVTGLVGVGPEARRASPRSSRRSRSTTSTATCTPTASASRTRCHAGALRRDRRDAGPAARRRRLQQLLNGAQRPGCLAPNYAAQQDADHESAYWKARDLIAMAHGRKTSRSSSPRASSRTTPSPTGRWTSTTPWPGPKRAWFGMWDHVRGNDTDEDGRPAMGRKGWFDETMRFFDHYVASAAADAATDKDPPLAVADRATARGAPRRSGRPPTRPLSTRTLQRRAATRDDGNNNGTASARLANGDGIWTISPPLGADAHFAGVAARQRRRLARRCRTPTSSPTSTTSTPTARRRCSRATPRCCPAAGTVGFDLYGNDWKIPAGHRIGVLVTGSNAEWWLHVPTLQTRHRQRGARSSCRSCAARARPRSRATRRSSSTTTRPTRRSRCRRTTRQRSDFTIPTTQTC